jgi:hypothetical protein
MAFKKFFEKRLCRQLKRVTGPVGFEGEGGSLQ